jgi:hypothetical protein
MDFDKKIIERILNTVKVDDGHILIGDPIKIEKYGQSITIRQLNWWNEWEKFSYLFGIFLNYFMNVCENFKMPTSEDDVKSFRDSFRLLISNKIYGIRAFKYLVKVCKFQGLDIGWAKKNFTIDDWAEMFLWVYIYNIFGVKKNLKNVLNLISKVQSV